MKYNISILLATSIMLANPVNAEKNQSVDDFPILGAVEFEYSCAVCHGLQGKGNGVMADSLKTKPSDLTLLKKNNHGHFPFTKVYRVIDGSPRVGIHGSRDMPVWGDRYRKEAKKYDADEYVYARGLILELLTYIMSLQEE